MFSRGDISGGLADLGVLLPMVVALVAINHVNPLTALALCGLFYIVTSLYYKVPIPVQPLKVFCTVAIAIKATPEIISSGALLIGFVFLFLSIPAVMNFIRRLFPLPIIRGIQLGTGLLLIDSGLKFLASLQVLIGGGQEQMVILGTSVPVSVIVGIFCIGILLLFYRHPKYPVGLVLMLVGMALAISFGARIIPRTEIVLPFALNSPFTYSRETALSALWLLVIPQIPLSIGNAIVATENTLKTYFKNEAGRAKATRLAFGMGCFNVLSGILGGIPCCHGCGGVTAHYRLGARTEMATLFTGLFYSTLAGLVYFFGMSVFSFFPYPVLGVLLIYVGLEHALLIEDMRSRQDLAVVFIIASIAFTTRDMTIAFIAGMIIRRIIRKREIFI